MMLLLLMMMMMMMREEEEDADDDDGDDDGDDDDNGDGDDDDDDDVWLCALLEATVGLCRLGLQPAQRTVAQRPGGRWAAPTRKGMQWVRGRGRRMAGSSSTPQALSPRCTNPNGAAFDSL